MNIGKCSFCHGFFESEECRILQQFLEIFEGRNRKTIIFPVANTQPFRRKVTVCAGGERTFSKGEFSFPSTPQYTWRIEKLPEQRIWF